MIRCLIIDDEPLATQLIKQYIDQIPFLETACIVNDGSSALETINAGGIDLVLLDIELPDINGIELMQMVWQRCNIIFITAYPQHALLGYEYEVIDYLVKPVNFHRFLQAAEKVRKRQLNAEKSIDLDYIFVKSGHQLQKIHFKEIRFIEGARDYIAFHTISGKILTLDKMRDVENVLPAELFIRIHKSYIVNKEKIKRVEKWKVYLEDMELPISLTYRNSFAHRTGLNFKR